MAQFIRILIWTAAVASYDLRMRFGEPKQTTVARSWQVSRMLRLASGKKSQRWIRRPQTTTILGVLQNSMANQRSARLFTSEWCSVYLFSLSFQLVCLVCLLSLSVQIIVLAGHTRISYYESHLPASWQHRMRRPISDRVGQMNFWLRLLQVPQVARRTSCGLLLCRQWL